MNQFPANLTRVNQTIELIEQSDDPARTLALVDTLGTNVRWLLVYAVDQARESGMTWQQVADVLGVTKQAAQQRFFDAPAGRTGSSATAHKG